MPIDPAALSSIAAAYAGAMTSIRGRRVQRLLQREFAGAAYVLPVQLGAGTAAVLGLSSSGAALCATDGTGSRATVVKWLHGASAGLETGFDLHKDSLPVLGTQAFPLSRLSAMGRLQVPAHTVARDARAWLSKVMCGPFTCASPARAWQGAATIHR